MENRALHLLFTCAIAFTAFGCATHRPSSAPKTLQTLKADPADVGTVADIVHASYETISGPAQHPWPWDRDRTLYMPQAIFVNHWVENGQVKMAIQTPEDFRRAFRSGQYETEIGRHIERYGNVAQVRSVTVARNDPSGPVIGRWVNYFQLYWDGTRWWIAAMVWDQERPGLPIPESWIGTLDEAPR